MQCRMIVAISFLTIVIVKSEYEQNPQHAFKLDKQVEKTSLSFESKRLPVFPSHSAILLSNTTLTIRKRRAKRDTSVYTVR